MDAFLDQVWEDQISGGYGPILDQIAAEEYIDKGEPLCLNCDDEGCQHCADIENDDVPLDGDHDSTMTSIGWGTDEDYGFFGGDDDSGGGW